MRRVVCTEGAAVNYVPESLKSHLRTAVGSLFSRPIQPAEELDFKRLYHHRLDVLGVGRKHLIEILKARFDRSAARAFHFDSWVPFLARYLYGSRNHLPAIAHLIIQDCLGIAFDEAMKFADGMLWKCANPFIECGKAMSERRRSGGKITERVKCLKCEFEADIPRKSPLGSKPKITFIINRGAIFERAAAKAIEKGKSIRELASETSISPWMWTMIFHEMGLLRGGLVRRRRRSSSARASKFREKNRRIFLEYLAAHSGATRTQLNKELRGPYRWLVANDRQWYSFNAPKQVTPKTRFSKLIQKSCEPHS